MKPTAAVLTVFALLSGCAGASRGPEVTQAASIGYLNSGSLAQLAGATVPPSSAEQETVRFDTVLPGSDRWWLAVVHAELRAPEAAQHFDCALNTRLLAQPRPALTRLMSRLLIDATSLSESLARRDHRPRPITVLSGLKPCQSVPEGVRRSSSWPANGAILGTAYGELFAALAPDRAVQVRAAGHEVGETRAICRMNWPADVAASRTLGKALYEKVASTPEFATDLQTARAEVAAARAEGLTNPSCAAERRALGIRPDAG